MGDVFSGRCVKEGDDSLEIYVWRLVKGSASSIIDVAHYAMHYAALAYRAPAARGQDHCVIRQNQQEGAGTCCNADLIRLSLEVTKHDKIAPEQLRGWLLSKCSLMAASVPPSRIFSATKAVQTRAFPIKHRVGRPYRTAISQHSIYSLRRAAPPTRRFLAMALAIAAGLLAVLAAALMSSGTSR